MYRWTEEEGEFSVEIEDESVEAAFREALVAYGDIVTEQRGGEPLAFAVSLEAEDLSSLLRAWLGELIRLDRDEDFTSERATRLKVEGPTLEATVAGQRLPRHERLTDEVIDAAIGQDDDGVWRARLRLGHS